MSASRDDVVDWAYTNAIRAGLRVHRGHAVMDGRDAVALDVDAVVSDVMALAEAHHIDALVALGFRAQGVVHPALDVENRRMRALARSIALHDARRRIDEALKARRVKAVTLKGAFVDARFFGGAGLRGSSDLDFLVSSSSRDDAAAAMHALGANEFVIEHARTTVKWGHARVFLWPRVSGDVMIDLHHAVVEAPPFRDFTDDAVARSVEVSTPLGSMRGLSPEDALVFTATNLACGGYSGRARALVDAPLALAEPSFDPERLLDVARTAKAERALAVLLALVVARTDGRVPRSLRSHIDTQTRNTRLGAVVSGRDGAPRLGHGIVSRAVLSDAARVHTVARWGLARVLDHVVRR